MTVREMRQGMRLVLFGIGYAALVTGCGTDDEAGKGSLSVLLEPEDVVVDGLEPGDGPENIRDGWAVEFDTYIATVGNIDVHLSSVEAEAPEVFVVDLTQIPISGLPLWSLDGLREGRWEFHFATPGAGDGSTPHESVPSDEYEEMATKDWTYLISGALTNENGQSCPPAALADPGTATPNGNMSGGNACYDATTVRFAFGATAETVFGPCEIDGVPGFTITSDSTQTVAITLHGDHLFFNGFPSGSEGGVMRLAQWLADCDLNLDGTVTREELETIPLSSLPELDERYDLTEPPIAIENLADYVTAQLKTQGHFQGEGECTIDGTAPAHD